MRTDEIFQVYNEVLSSPMRSLNYDYLSHADSMSHQVPTETGDSLEAIKPSFNSNDVIFSELPSSVINDVRVLPFLIVLYDEFLKNRILDYTYLPLLVGEHNDNSIILDWIYETIRISFYFMKDKDVYSVTRYDVKKNSFTQKIEDLPSGRYKEIASQVIHEIA